MVVEEANGKESLHNTLVHFIVVGNSLNDIKSKSQSGILAFFFAA